MGERSVDGGGRRRVGGGKVCIDVQSGERRVTRALLPLIVNICGALEALEYSSDGQTVFF